MVNKKVWRPFEEAREFARSLNLRNRDGWYEYCKSGERPDDIPANPGIIYKNDGWKGYPDWLGNENITPYTGEWRPFEEAREFARSLNLKNEDEWEQYSTFGKDGILKPNDIPVNPNRIYKNDGWKGWTYWLGNEWRPFEEAREFARSLNLKSWVEWQQYLKSGKDGIPKPDDIPSSPDSNYKNNGWIDWGDWLGTGSIAPKNREFLPFEEAREFARSLNLRNRDGWYEYCKSGERPDDIPANPGIIYKNDGWKGVIDWLGNENITPYTREWRPLEEAREFVHSLKLKGLKEWYQYCTSGKKPNDIPSTPDDVYKNDGWKGWTDWLWNEELA